MRETISSAIGKTCSPVVHDANTDDSKIQPSSYFLILASSLTKQGAIHSSVWGGPFRTAAAYCMAGKGVGLACATACWPGAGGSVFGTGVSDVIDRLRAGCWAGIVAVAVTTDCILSPQTGMESLY